MFSGSPLAKPVRRKPLEGGPPVKQGEFLSFPSCEESANGETIQKAKLAEMRAEKKEPPSSDGPLI